MALHCQLLLYLDKMRFLEDMRKDCELYVKEQLTEKITNTFPPLKYLLEIDVMDVLEEQPELGDCLIREPLKWQRMCSDVLFACLLSVHDGQAHNVQSAQVFVWVRLKCVPKMFISLNSRYYGGLASFEGVLIAVSKPSTYVYHTVWCCAEECEGSEVILQYIPKSPPKCYVCKSVLFENSGLRRCGDQVAATFKLPIDLSAKDFKIVDDLMPRLELGLKYMIYAVVVRKQTTVWSIEEVVPLPAPITYPVSKDITNLFEDCKGIPWKFIYCLASSIGINVCPINCFMHLKINLLISLTSVKANTLTGCNIVHVLVAGHDTQYVGQLMTEAARLAERFNFLSTANTEISTALMASSGGVCIMSHPFHVYNHKQISFIMAAVESGEVATDTEKAKLRCAVWTQGMDFKKLVLHNAASVFGASCRGDFGEFGDEIGHFVLENAMEPTASNTEEIQLLKDMSLYIELVAGIEVVLDNLAEILLRNYFLSARRKMSCEVSMGSMKALVTICLTSARICRRSVANVNDAVLAIWLFMSGSNESRIFPEEYLQSPPNVKKLDKMMNSFIEWLEKFTGTCILGTQ